MIYRNNKRLYDLPFSKLLEVQAKLNTKLLSVDSKETVGGKYIQRKLRQWLTINSIIRKVFANMYDGPGFRLDRL